VAFIETADGREVYFHCNSVLDDAFEHLTVGSEVRFVEEMGEKGPHIPAGFRDQSESTQASNNAKAAATLAGLQHRDQASP
jgi:cold shock CspA family protein